MRDSVSPLAGEVDPHLRPQQLCSRKLDALERWANHLAVAIAQASGANVVKLQPPRRQPTRGCCRYVLFLAKVRSGIFLSLPHLFSRLDQIVACGRAHHEIYCHFTCDDEARAVSVNLPLDIDGGLRIILHSQGPARGPFFTCGPP
jgi:hypothetical protein